MLGIKHSKFYNSLAAANENVEHVDHNIFDNIPGVIRFMDDTYGYLTKILKRFDSKDPYLLCPAYHAFTGRKGLWGYSRQGALLLIAIHPNLENTIIFYPQFGNQKINLTLEIMDFVKENNYNFQIVRSPADYAAFSAASMQRKQKQYSLTAKTEDVLDWTYPVYTLSTHDVLEAKGRKFRGFRYDLIQIEDIDITVEPLNPMNDADEIKTIVTGWANNKSDLEDEQDTIDAYLFLIRLMQNPVFNLSGLKFYKDGKLVAFEVWSIINKPSGNIANNLAGMNTHSVESLKGFSSYQYHTVCKKLHEDGIDHVCIGGSETVGLDHFKRKMNPVHALHLKTIDIKPIEVNTLNDTAISN